MTIPSKESIEKVIATAAFLAQKRNLNILTNILKSQYSYEVDTSDYQYGIIIAFEVDIEYYQLLLEKYELDQLEQLINPLLREAAKKYLVYFSCRITIKHLDNPNWREELEFDVSTRDIETSPYNTEVFVLMPFRDQDLNDLYEQYVVRITRDLGHSISRGDSFQSEKNNITQDVISGIYNCKLLIAFCHHFNPNVMYELGIAHILKKSVILIGNSTDDLPYYISSKRLITCPYPIAMGMPKFEKALKDAINSQLSPSTPPTIPSSMKDIPF